MLNCIGGCNGGRENLNCYYYVDLRNYYYYYCIDVEIGFGYCYYCG